jgi:hypothetical protein
VAAVVVLSVVLLEEALVVEGVVPPQPLSTLARAIVKEQTIASVLQR